MNTLLIRKRMQDRQAELLRRLGRITKDVRHSAGLAADFEEQATELENDEVLAFLDSAARKEIQQIGTALQRLDRQQYGICDACNKPLGPERLEALPYATLCVKCESKEAYSNVKPGT
ncbi:MAG TPA: TraR/DksA C4-type zinc finger protein [Terriglobia bacterium]|nr:TraR/DksA C4-type zinc finger protein [Terriglobia bacterium]